MALNVNMRILVVDDMATMRKIVKRMLSEIGFKSIEEAEDGKPAWDLIQQRHDEGQPYEFVVSDWNMPEMSGLDLLKNVRDDDRFKKLPFLMVTAEAEQSNVITAVKAGVSNYVVKPFAKDTLMGKIEKIFGT